MKLTSRRSSTGTGRASPARQTFRTVVRCALALGLVAVLAKLSAALHLPLGAVVTAFVGVLRSLPRA